MDFEWEDGFVIAVSAGNDSVTITANKEGLRSLASHLIALSEEKAGSHIHLDQHNSLEDGSADLIIDKIE